ncbi:MAG TPA: NFACT RNA binding domain-containing protein [Candidatus Limiplasma sp.]|nr:NFACT RNA binding domain-containing protein [Candidatus Limiplasma sp.]HRX07778.1 NFACT RNA binding domain-containing protein [Candidatus Limiplasma sp.]
MAMDGFTLSFLARELRDKLVGGRVDKVNQPERDILLLLIRNQGANHRLLLSANANAARAQLTVQSMENPAEPPVFCMLLRKHLSGARVTAVEQLGCDRVLILTFQCLSEMGDEVQKTLVLEAMGRHSNLTLVDENGVTIDSIHHVNADISRVRVVMPGKPFTLPPEQDKLNPMAMTAAELSGKLSLLASPLYKGLIEVISGLSTISAKEICAQIGMEHAFLYAPEQIPEIAEKVAAFYARLPELRPPVVISDAAGKTLEYLPYPYRSYAMSLQTEYETLSEAMDSFYAERELHAHISQRGSGIRKRVKSNIARLEKKRAKMVETLTQNDRAEENRIFGELLTANLHSIEKGAAAVNVVNYYDAEQATVTIPLSPELSPSRNAQSYYKKYRKAKGAQQYAQKEMGTIERDLEVLESVMEDLDKCTTTADLNEIKDFLTDNGFLRPEAGTVKRKKRKEGQPYRFIAPDGTEILVGKNSVQNDRITLHAKPEETWLHAQNVAGSHVVVRTPDTPADETLLFAAKLAAYYSKGRNHPAFPVDYTLRKHVKKKSGTPSGFVIYDHFKTIHIGLSSKDMETIRRLAMEAAGGTA